MIVVLTGGTGGAKLLEGLSLEADPGELVAICNTGDDLRVHGLYVAPDLDTILYTLAGMVDRVKGWGVREETFTTLERLAELGEETWFRLGDKDLATHLVRTRLLGEGLTLSQVTERLARTLGIRARVLPMSDDRVETRIMTPEGELSFQEFFVRDGWSHLVEGIAFAGVQQSRPAPGILESIGQARAVILCPSNPATSLGPILAVPGIREALKETAAPVAAVSPMVGAMPFSGPAHKFMAHLEVEASSFGVASLYRDFLDLILVSPEDSPLVGRIESMGIRAIATPIVMNTVKQKQDLAHRLLQWI